MKHLGVLWAVVAVSVGCESTSSQLARHDLEDCQNQLAERAECADDEPPQTIEFTLNGPGVEEHATLSLAEDTRRVSIDAGGQTCWFITSPIGPSSHREMWIVRIDCGGTIAFGTVSTSHAERSPIVAGLIWGEQTEWSAQAAPEGSTAEIEVTTGD